MDFDQLQLPESLRAARKNDRETRAPRHQSGQAFLKGPIPMSWLGQAAALPGKAPVIVGLAL